MKCLAELPKKRMDKSSCLALDEHGIILTNDKLMEKVGTFPANIFEQIEKGLRLVLQS